ncbi:MAG: hypothetical protein BWY82_02992 [Verrucomicrobia bacterium ADurb.Bin474]|nr:MAG: hypothetical protein BWY82_02992 [Verrucomicrobia bacterium ADurb.Bin474]
MDSMTDAVSLSEHSLAITARLAPSRCANLTPAALDMLIWVDA